MPLFFFSEIPNAPKKEYQILLYDLTNYTTSKLSKGSNYIVFRAELKKGFEKIANPNLIHEIHFPEKCFEIAWQKSYPKQLNPENKYDALITFKRPSLKRIIITQTKIIELKE